MKIKLAILENDVNYLNRIVVAFNTRYADKLEIYSFTKYDAAIEALTTSKIDVLIANDSFDVNTKEIPAKCGFAYLVDSVDIENVRDQRAICKFQKADLIYKQILGIYSEKAENMSKINYIVNNGYIKQMFNDIKETASSEIKDTASAINSKVSTTIKHLSKKIREEINTAMKTAGTKLSEFKNTCEDKLRTAANEGADKLKDELCNRIGKALGDSDKGAFLLKKASTHINIEATVEVKPLMMALPFMADTAKSQLTGTSWYTVKYKGTAGY